MEPTTFNGMVNALTIRPSEYGPRTVFLIHPIGNPHPPVKAVVMTPEQVKQIIDLLGGINPEDVDTVGIDNLCITNHHHGIHDRSIFTSQRKDGSGEIQIRDGGSDWTITFDNGERAAIGRAFQSNSNFELTKEVERERERADAERDRADRNLGHNRVLRDSLESSRSEFYRMSEEQRALADENAVLLDKSVSDLRPEVERLTDELDKAQRQTNEVRLSRLNEFNRANGLQQQVDQQNQRFYEARKTLEGVEEELRTLREAHASLIDKCRVLERMNDSKGQSFESAIEPIRDRIDTYTHTVNAIRELRSAGLEYDTEDLEGVIDDAAGDIAAYVVTIATENVDKPEFASAKEPWSLHTVSGTIKLDRDDVDRFMTSVGFEPGSFTITATAKDDPDTDS